MSTEVEEKAEPTASNPEVEPELTELERLSRSNVKALEAISKRGDDVTKKLQYLDNNISQLLVEMQKQLQDATGSTKRKLGRILIIFKNFQEFFGANYENQFLINTALNNRLSAVEDLHGLTLRTLKVHYPDVLKDLDVKIKEEATKVIQARKEYMQKKMDSQRLPAGTDAQQVVDEAIAAAKGDAPSPKPNLIKLPS